METDYYKILYVFLSMWQYTVYITSYDLLILALTVLLVHFKVHRNVAQLHILSCYKRSI